LPSATPSPSVAPSQPSPVDPLSRIYLVTTDQGKGSGFFLAMRDGTFFVTNFHVLEGAKSIQCSNSSGAFAIAAGQVQVAADRDLVRIPAVRTAGLPLGVDPVIGESAAAYGDSGGKDVVTKLNGTVLGVGPKELEVSAQFIPGNSGGPIITGSGQVIGVATYVARESGIPDWVKSGTRFKGTRRFGVRVTDDIVWTSMPLALFQDQSTRISQADGLLDELISTSRELFYSPFKHTLTTNFGNIQAISNFVESYNASSKDYHNATGSTVTTSGLRALNGKFSGRIRQCASDLAAAIDSIQSDLAFSSQNITAPYLHGRMAETIASMRDLSQFIKDNGQGASSTSLFRFRK
jgi:hypothetical protein